MYASYRAIAPPFMKTNTIHASLTEKYPQRDVITSELITILLTRGKRLIVSYVHTNIYYIAEDTHLIAYIHCTKYRRKNKCAMWHGVEITKVAYKQATQ